MREPRQFRDGVGATQVRLWSHELKRVFEDRLTTSDDHDWFVSQLTECVSSKFGMKWADIVRTERADSASRRVEAPSRHRRDSSPGMMDVGGFFFEFEAVRTETAMPRAGRRPGRPSAASGLILMRPQVKNTCVATSASSTRGGE